MRASALAVVVGAVAASTASAQPVVRVVDCPAETGEDLRELVALETDAPVDVAVTCTGSSMTVRVRHRESSGERDLEAPRDRGPEGLRNLALQIAEAAELAAAAPAVVPEVVEDDPPAPEVPVPEPAPPRHFVDLSLGLAIDGRPELRGGAEVGLRLGKTFGLRLLGRVLAGPEPGAAIGTVWFAAAGAGPHASLGGGLVRFEVALLGLLGAAIAVPDQATSTTSNLWFAGTARGGVVLGRGAFAFAALLEAGVQRRLDQRVLDESGAVVSETEGSAFIAALWLSARWRLSPAP